MVHTKKTTRYVFTYRYVYLFTKDMYSYLLWSPVIECL